MGHEMGYLLPSNVGRKPTVVPRYSICAQIMPSNDLFHAARALRYIRSRVDPEKLRRSAVTLIYYRCEECGKRFYYQHLLDYDDILSRIITSQKANVHFLLDILHSNVKGTQGEQNNINLILFISI